MKKHLLRDANGIAKPILVVIVVLVLAGAGGGYYFYNKNKSSNTGSSTSSSSKPQTAAELAATKEAEVACNKSYNDKDFCKFASSFSGKGPYTINMTKTDTSGKAETTTMSIDAKDNSLIISQEDGKETAAYISLDGNIYSKNETDGSWTKYPKSSSTTPVSTPTSDLKFDAAAEAAKPADQRMIIKNLGKEKCGSSNCLKYSFVDPTESADEGTLWIGDKDYQLKKMSYKDKNGSVNVVEFSYSDVTINIPSPVKDATTTP